MERFEEKIDLSIENKYKELKRIVEINLNIKDVDSEVIENIVKAYEDKKDNFYKKQK